MRNGAKKNLSDEDREFIEALRGLGVRRSVAILIAYLATVEEASSREIKEVTSLRLPEVSLAMRTLRALNWIDERAEESRGKGRPMKIYALMASVEEIIGHFERENLEKAALSGRSFQMLRDMIS